MEINTYIWDHSFLARVPQHCRVQRAGLQSHLASHREGLSSCLSSSPASLWRGALSSSRWALSSSRSLLAVATRRHGAPRECQDKEPRLQRCEEGGLPDCMIWDRAATSSRSASWWRVLSSQPRSATVVGWPTAFPSHGSHPVISAAKKPQFGHLLLMQDDACR